MGTVSELATRLGNYARLQLFGVLAPGGIILIELWLTVWRPDEVPNGITSHGAILAALAVLLAIYAAYVVGFLARELSWATADALAWFLRHMPWLAKRKPLLETTTGDVKRELGKAYGEQNVDAVLRAHPVVASSADGGDVLSYSKRWLRTRTPELSIDYLESEINVLLGTIVPLALAPIATFRYFHSSWQFYAVLVGALVLIPLIVFKREQLARGEVSDGLRNLCLSRWFAEADR